MSLFSLRHVLELSISNTYLDSFIHTMLKDFFVDDLTPYYILDSCLFKLVCFCFVF